MSSAERALSLNAGGALLSHGWRTGGLAGALGIVAGAYGLWRGAAGHCRLKQALSPTPFEQQFSREHHWPISEAITRSVTINRSLEEVRDFRGTVLRQAIRACRKGGMVSVVGVYGGLLDKFPMGAIVNKALTVRSGQQPGQRYAPTLFEHIQKGELDPSWLLTHPMSPEDGAEGYRMFKEKTDQCIRAVFKP